MKKYFISFLWIIFAIFTVVILFQTFFMDKNMKEGVEIKNRQKIFAKISKTFKSLPISKKRMLVIDFKGDLQATQVGELKNTITSIVANSRKSDHIFLRLESPGGVMHKYGLAAHELLRLKKAGLKLTVSIDAVAASGGYMMACVADEIVAAPFSYIGSIGVMSGVFNFNKIMDSLGIAYEKFTAGEHKGGVPMFGPVTKEEREHHQEFIDRAYRQFKSFVHQNRPEVDIEKIATGEVWTAQEAIELGLVDGLSTSEEFLLIAKEEYNIFEVSYLLPEQKGPLWKKLLKKVLPL